MLYRNRYHNSLSVPATVRVQEFVKHCMLPERAGSYTTWTSIAAVPVVYSTIRVVL